MIAKRTVTVALSACLVGGLCVSGPAYGTPLLGSDMRGSDQNSLLYDIDPLTGLASNPRDTGIKSLAGIAFSPDGVLYGLSTFSLPQWNENSLFRIDPVSGASTLVGDTGLTVAEGGLAFDRTTGLLYGSVGLLGLPNVSVLFRIDRGTGVGTPVGNIPGDPNVSGMAFDNSGTLYVLDTYWQRVLTVDPSDAQVLGSVPLSVSLGPAAGMDCDPQTGTLYVADGSDTGTKNLYTLEPSTGTLSYIGSTGLDRGLAGLAFVPEPSAMLLLGPACLILLRRDRGAHS